MKKQTAHKPNDQQVVLDNTTALTPISQSAEPISTETKTQKQRWRLYLDCLMFRGLPYGGFPCTRNN